MRKGLKIFMLFLLLQLSVKAAFIDIGEPVPFGCPSACAGSTLLIKIFHIQGLPTGAVVQAWLSNSSGVFVNGVGLISSTRYSTVSASGPWINGAYSFSGDVTDLYFEITIPAAQSAGSSYNIKFRSSVSPFTTGGTLNLPGGGTCSGLTISPGYTPLAAIPSTSIGSGQWIAHAYTWTPTTSAALTTPALVAQQTFFSTTNYKGHFLKNSLNFDLDFTGNGSGKMPGAVGVLNDGTSFQCGDGYTTNYSLRFYRNENFSPGFYRLKLGADDGARLSIDGGITWILNMFTEHAYDTLNTTSSFPSGVCLNGPTQLVIEYFQRPVDAEVSFSATLLTPSILQPLNQQICEGTSGIFGVGSTILSANYQWMVSSDGGATYSNLFNSSNYAGVTNASLQIISAPSSFNNNQYKCIISGICGNAYETSSATLTVSPIVAITSQPAAQIVCVGDTVSFSVSTNGVSTFQWQENSGSGFTNLFNGGIYSNVNGADLFLNGVSLTSANFQYQCVVNGCGPAITTVAVPLTFAQPVVTAQPQNQEICGTKTIKLSSNASNASVFQWQLSLDSGAVFTNLTDNLIYLNTSSPELTIVNADASFNGFIYRCSIGGCGQSVYSSSAKVAIKEIANDDFVPNVFTPNNDGFNDYFELKSAGLMELSGIIYNRWGQEVYKLSKGDDKWDGKFNGTTVNDGVYFYTISATSECEQTKFEKNGTLSVYK